MRARTSFVLGLVIVAAALTTPLHAQQGRGRIVCRVTENGEAASGTIEVQERSGRAEQASCGTPLAVAAGTHRVLVRLDGALDRPQEARSVRVGSGQTEVVRVDFATGILLVRVKSSGRRAAAMATIYRGGKRVGTLGSGVGGHLSTGTYDVVVRYRTEEKRFEGVRIRRGQKRTVEAEF